MTEIKGRKSLHFMNGDFNSQVVYQCAFLGWM